MIRSVLVQSTLAMSAMTAGIALAGSAAADTPKRPDAPKSYVSQTVAIPAELKTEAQIAAYTHALLKAVDRVCWRAASPMLGGSYDAFRDCLNTTTQETAAKDPTGLLAAQLNQTSTLALAQK